MDFETININDGVDIVFAGTNRFKTNEISISFLAPLCEETAAANALLAYIITRTTREYPDVTSFNKKLAMLYGAGVVGFVSKVGENQLITIEASSLDDRFSLNFEKISAEVFDFLCRLVFDANLDENGDFRAEDIEREKRLLIEKLESEENDKRIFALRRLESIMFDGEPYSINRFGSKESISKVDSAALKKALDYLVKNSRVQITVVGNASADLIRETAEKYFKNIQREYIPPQQSVFKGEAKEVKTVTDRMEVKQGKLVLGFRVNRESESEGAPDLRLFNDILGGGPYSKLFANVREKLSLCYYCSSRSDRHKSNIIIQCGCEEENMDKAVSEILNQLEEIKKGNIDEEFAAANIAISDALNSVNDDSITLLTWYTNQISDKRILSPSESAAQNESVSKEDICNMAKLLSLDTVYKLVAKKEGE